MKQRTHQTKESVIDIVNPMIELLAKFQNASSGNFLQYDEGILNFNFNKQIELLFSIPKNYQ